MSTEETNTNNQDPDLTDIDQVHAMNVGTKVTA